MTTADPTITIRTAHYADAQTLADYNIAMAWETEKLRLEPATVLAGVEAALSDRHKGMYFVAEVDGALAAQLMITHEWSDWRNADIWWIQSVYVHPDHRRRGLFKALFLHVQRAAHQSGAAGLRLYVEEENATGQSTYKTMGMNLTHYRIMEKMRAVT